MAFTILQWNARYIFKKWPEFKKYVTTLDNLSAFRNLT